MMQGANAMIHRILVFLSVLGCVKIKLCTAKRHILATGLDYVYFFE